MESPDLILFVVINYNESNVPYCCNFRPLDCISKARLKVVVARLPKISCKYPHLIRSKFTYVKTRDLTNWEYNFMVDVKVEIYREIWCKARMNFRKKCS